MNLNESKKQDLDQSYFIGCALISHDMLAVLMLKEKGKEKWDQTPPVRVFSIPFGEKNKDKEPRRLGWDGDQFYYPMIAKSTPYNFLITDNNGGVFHADIKTNNTAGEKNIRIDGEIQLMSDLQGLKNIHGAIYVAGNFRQIIRRNNIDNWSDVTAGHVQEEARKRYRETFGTGNDTYQTGFNCIDGFESDKELYAAGEGSDVWYFNGENWTPIDLDVMSENIISVCCAEDGLVYFGCKRGKMIKGRAATWEEVQMPFTEYPITSIVSFNDKIYFATPNRLYEYDGKSVEPVVFNTKNGEVPRRAGFLDVGYGHLLSVGEQSIALFDGERWNILYGGAEKDFQTDLDIILKDN